METETPTPTVTFTPTPTLTPTPDFYVTLTTPDGNPARIAREMSVADMWLILLLTAILLSMWLMWLINRAKGGNG